ncbi:MAG: TetR/AcrR family transcriptional regulator [Candidatus Devosia euplotis]|nr:TetR/AcrR family transcriptional regulator [Candidatus Devosia euplotis]
MTETRKSEQTRQRILSTGCRLVLGVGFTGMGLKELLTASGVPKGSFYHYFVSKEAFGCAILEDYVAEYLGRMDALADLPQSGGARLMRYCEAWLASDAGQSITENCLVVKLASEIPDMSEGMRSILDAGVNQLVARLERMLGEGIADGSITALADPAEAARLLYGQWLGAAILSKLGKTQQPLFDALNDTNNRFIP